MGQWHREHPEEAERIAALPPSQQNGAERAAIGDPAERADLARKRLREAPVGPVLCSSAALVAALEQYEDESGQEIDAIKFARAILTYEELTA